MKEIRKIIISEGELGKRLGSSALFSSVGRAAFERLILGDGIFTPNGITLDAKGSLVLQGLLTRKIERLLSDVEHFREHLRQDYGRPGIDFPADKRLVPGMTLRQFDWPSSLTNATLSELVDQQLKKWGITRSENVRLVQVLESGIYFPDIEMAHAEFIELATLTGKTEDQVASELSILHKRFHSHSRPTGFIVGLSNEFYRDSKEFRHDDDQHHHIWAIPDGGDHLSRYVDFILPLSQRSQKFLLEIDK